MPDKAADIGSSQMGKHFDYHAWKFGFYGVIYCKTVAHITSIIIILGFSDSVTILGPNSPFMTSQPSTQLNDWHIPHLRGTGGLAKYSPH